MGVIGVIILIIIFALLFWGLDKGENLKSTEKIAKETIESAESYKSKVDLYSLWLNDANKNIEEQKKEIEKQQLEIKYLKNEILILKNRIKSNEGL